jgi:hypothetical protein
VPAAALVEHPLGDPISYVAITVSTSAVGLTAANLDPAAGPRPDAVVISVEAQPIRYRVDGTDPTSTEGHPAVDGDVIVLRSHQALKQLRAIRSGATDATLRVTYYRSLQSVGPW